MSNLPTPPHKAPPSWAAALERARADAAAGRTVDAGEFLRRLESEDAGLCADADAVEPRKAAR